MPQRKRKLLHALALCYSQKPTKKLLMFYKWWWSSNWLVLCQHIPTRLIKKMSPTDWFFTSFRVLTLSHLCSSLVACAIQCVWTSLKYLFAKDLHWKTVPWNCVILCVQHAEMIFIWQLNFAGGKKGSILEIDWFWMTGFDIFSLKSHFISKYRKGRGRRNQEPILKRNRLVDKIFFFFSFIWKDILQFNNREKKTHEPAFPLRTKKILSFSVMGLTQCPPRAKELQLRRTDLFLLCKTFLHFFIWAWTQWCWMFILKRHQDRVSAAVTW